jgi:hypothetical protein
MSQIRINIARTAISPGVNICNIIVDWIYVKIMWEANKKKPILAPTLAVFSALLYDVID